jgi:hypothetical protein
MSTDSKPAFDFNKVRKCIRFSRRYEEDIYTVPFWIGTNGEETDEGTGDPAGLRVSETKRIYYMKSRWPNKNGTDDDAILPLALKSYYDGTMFTDNEWETDDEEGVKQFFYKKGEEEEDEYEYATSWTIKTDETVGPGEVVIPYTGKVKQEEFMFDWSTGIHVPGETHFLTFINLSTATIDPFAPNARNKEKQPHLVSTTEKMGKPKFENNNDTPNKLTKSAYSSRIATVTPQSTLRREEAEEYDLLQRYLEEKEVETSRESDEETERVEAFMLCSDCGEDPCVWEQHECAICEFAKYNLCTYRPWKSMYTLSYNRKCLYRKAAREIFGRLSRMERKKFSMCVVRGVRAMYPDPEGRYMGHRDVL